MRSTWRRAPTAGSSRSSGCARNSPRTPSSGPGSGARPRRRCASKAHLRGTVLAVEADASCPFVVMEYVPGPTPAEHVGGDMAHGFAVGPAEALVAIHRCGLVHRDLKPGNVLLSDQGPKVIDCGIAQAADATAPTRTGVTLGTVSRRPTCSPGRADRGLRHHRTAAVRHR